MTRQLDTWIPRLACGLLVIVASVGAFTGGIWGIVGIAGALILYILTAIADRKLPRPDTIWCGMAIITLVVMGISAALSPTPHLAWPTVTRLAGVFIPLSLFFCPRVLEHVGRDDHFRWLVIAGILGAVGLGIELLMGAPLLFFVKHTTTLTEYNRGLSYLVILAFPILAWLSIKQQKMGMLVFALIMFLPASLTESRAAKLALLSGLIVTVTAYLLPRLTRCGLMVFTTMCIGWPFVAQDLFSHATAWVRGLPDSWQARMEIWDYMSYRIMEKPWFGWGIGSSSQLDYKMPHGALYHFINQPAPHPHNVMTELWVEMGVPGMALGLAFVYMTLHAVSRLERSFQPFAIGSWTAALCLSLVAYNFWTDSLFAAFALTALAFAQLKNNKKI